MDDGGLVRIEASGKLLLQSSKFPGKLARTEQGLPHLDESPNDKNTHLHRAWAAENVRAT